MPKNNIPRGINHRVENFKYHFFAGAMMSLVWILGLSLGISPLPMVEAFSFKLSRLLYDSDEDADVKRRGSFPRRDLEEEYGKQALECLIDSALGLIEDRDVCLSDLSALERTSYGVDVSFPIKSDELKFAANDRSDFYMDFIDGCRNYYMKASSRSSSHGSVCDDSETDRFDMNRNQPPVMQNYTTLGFQKTKVPDHLMEELIEFWDQNSMTDIKHELPKETWYPGDTHTNHWESSTHMLDVGNPNLKGGGPRLKQRLWKAAETTLLQWLQTEADLNLKPSEKEKGKADRLKLTPTSLYGIRMYKSGAVLAPHVDRLPLVTSAIINVAQDVEEPWPLEVYAHDGNAYNVTLEPGDMLLYESHSVIHGRPFPLKGNYYANIFIHFEPENHCIRHAERMKGVELAEDVEEMFKRALRKQIAQKKSAEAHGEKYNSGVQDKLSATELPFFIEPYSYQAQRWKQEVEYKKNIHDLRQAPPPSLANVLASRGDLKELKLLALSHPGILLKPDNNGWQPIHEAARSGKKAVLEYLLENGADPNVRTNFGKGGNAVWWCEEQHGVDHPATKLLKKAGGIRIAPHE